MNYFRNEYGRCTFHRIFMMLLPHNREFRYRRHVFLGVTGISLFLAGITSGLNLAPMSAGIGIAAVVAAIMYFYSAWITRFDLRFRYVHPRKIRFTSLLTFYLPLVISALLLVASPWALQQPWMDTPDKKCIYFLLIPVILSAAAGAHGAISGEPNVLDLGFRREDGP